MEHARRLSDTLPSMPDDRLRELVKDWGLLSGAGQGFDIGNDLRRVLAVFKNGIVLVAQGQRHAPEVKLMLDRGRRMGLKLTDVREVDPKSIERVYGAPATAYNLNHWKTLELERQKSLARIIAEAAELGASDVHMRVLPDATEVKVRVNGRMRALREEGSQEGQEMIRAAFAVATGQGSTGTDSTFQQGAMFQKSGLLPGNVEMLRLQYTPTSDMRGALVMRLKYVGKSGETDVDSLGYSAQQAADLKKMRLKTNGMYIFAGKVSSGKTTTLQRCLNAMYLDKRKEISIYAAEDPKELELLGAIQAQITAGANANDAFKMAMKAALRSDPNVIVLGEIRSEELTSMAVDAAKTGHALWSTVHAGSALGILNRLINLGADREDLKDPRTVGGLIYQRLLGVLCRKCRIPLHEAVAKGEVEQDLAEKLIEITGEDDHALQCRGPGCPGCLMGLAGRTVVAETIRPDAKLLELYMDESRIRAEQYWLAPREEGGMGGAPVMHHAMAKVGAGLVDINEVQEEVDLLENYERELSHLVPRLRREIADIRQGIGTPR
jgi:type II secretory ATPase GspE/PulE/Tfp pilus assembly ATPase PilB-like protein